MGSESSSLRRTHCGFWGEAEDLSHCSITPGTLLLAPDPQHFCKSGQRNAKCQQKHLQGGGDRFDEVWEVLTLHPSGGREGGTGIGCGIVDLDVRNQSLPLWNYYNITGWCICVRCSVDTRGRGLYNLHQPEPTNWVGGLTQMFLQVLGNADRCSQHLGGHGSPGPILWHNI